MTKLLFFLLLLYLAWRLLFKQRPERRVNPPTPTESAGERMVPCAYCGVNHPISESIVFSGKYYCTEPHRLADKSAEG